MKVTHSRCFQAPERYTPRTASWFAIGWVSCSPNASLLQPPPQIKRTEAMFCVTRADKALALKAVLEGPYEPEQLPAQLIQPVNGKLLWLVDQAAGSKLAADVRN